MHVYIHVMTKVISISDEAYNYSKSLKEENDSFSKVIRRLVPKKSGRDILKLAGALNDESFSRNIKEVIKNREKIKFRVPRFG